MAQTPEQAAAAALAHLQPAPEGRDPHLARHPLGKANHPGVARTVVVGCLREPSKAVLGRIEQGAAAGLGADPDSAVGGFVQGIGEMAGEPGDRLEIRRRGGAVVEAGRSTGPEAAPAVQQQAAEGPARQEALRTTSPDVGLEPEQAEGGIGDPDATLAVLGESPGIERRQRRPLGIAFAGTLKQAAGGVAPEHTHALHANHEPAIAATGKTADEAVQAETVRVALADEAVPVEAEQTVGGAEPDQAIAVFGDGRDPAVGQVAGIGDGDEGRRIEGRFAQPERGLGRRPGRRGQRQDARQRGGIDGRQVHRSRKHQDGGQNESQQPPATRRPPVETITRTGHRPHAPPPTALPRATRSWHSASRVEGEGVAQAKGSRSTMLSSRSGPVLTMASGQPESSSNARR